MTKLPLVSGEKAIKSLCKSGFVVTRQKGSHIRLKKMTFQGMITVTVPLHNVLDRGTLKSILRTAGVSVDEFVGFL